ncbi:hypothetical protein [Variovorax sp. 38R]|uniref:hypothetical protein n=1 Tax=Variovorax sp. 38R TaxID=2774875 RepID=UPI001783F633|nr:hypothetical protein [Variovorax sp. 38R]QOF80427.1 hypothetical protein IG196_08615 [Variovorax sp. 38R]
MIPLSQLRVIVEETSKGQFSWALLERKEACIVDDCVAQSDEGFAEFDLALEAGFADLKVLASKA